MKKHWSFFTKYQNAFNYIQEHKPKLIIEYGGGESTAYVEMLLEELGYGGKIIAFESEQEWFDDHTKLGYNKNNSIRLAPIKWVNQEKGYLEYIHSYDDLLEVDMVIIDGPDYRIYLDKDGNPSGVTTNLQRLVELKGEEIPYFIDGRTGCVNYYKNVCKYTKHIFQDPETRK